jgi:hypothetical protein
MKLRPQNGRQYSNYVHMFYKFKYTKKGSNLTAGTFFLFDVFTKISVLGAEREI